MNEEKVDTLREKLADLCHRQWSGWTEYMFSKGTLHDDSSLTLPPWAVERWTRQINTPYTDLSETEQNSDRIEADKFLAVIEPKPNQRPRGSHIWTTKRKPRVSFQDRVKELWKYL